MHNNKVRRKKTWLEIDSTRLICTAFFMFSFWDFYFYGIGRVLDYVGITLLLIEMFCITRGMDRLSSLIKDGGIQFFLFSSAMLITLCAIVGMFCDEILPSMAILTGVYLVFNRMLLARIDLDGLAKLLDFLILLNIIIFFTQFIVFKLTGSVLDITKAVGSIPSRVYNKDLGHFRPAGIFQEPNSYCVSLFMLMILRVSIGNVSPYIKWGFLLTVLISQSLWGVGAVFLYLMLYVSSAKDRLMVIVVFMIAIFIAWHAGYIESYMNHSIIMHRMENIGDDSSRKARYGSLDTYFSWDNILGFGINTTRFQSIAANGIAFMIFSFGWVGLLLIMLTLLYSFYKFGRVKLFISVFFLLTTDQILTYMAFWAWLAMLFRVSAVSHAAKDKKRFIDA